MIVTENDYRAKILAQTNRQYVKKSKYWDAISNKTPDYIEETINKKDRCFHCGMEMLFKNIHRHYRVMHPEVTP
jgi:hypothetical protein